MIFYGKIWYKKSNSQQMVLISSEPLWRVRVLLGAPEKKLHFCSFSKQVWKASPFRLFFLFSDQTQLAFHWRVGRYLSSEENCSKSRNSCGLRHFATKYNLHFVGVLPQLFYIRMLFQGNNHGLWHFSLFSLF